MWRRWVSIRRFNPPARSERRRTVLRALMLGGALLAFLLPPMPVGGRVHPAASSHRQLPRAHVPPAEQTVYAPLASWPASSDVELALNSNSPDPMVVTPILYTAEGVAVLGQRITLAPAEVRPIALTDLLAGGRQEHTIRGVALRYFGQMLELGVQITMRLGEIGSVDVPVTGPGDHRSTVQEAVWWMPCRAQRRWCSEMRPIRLSACGRMMRQVRWRNSTLILMPRGRSPVRDAARCPSQRGRLRRFGSRSTGRWEAYARGESSHRRRSASSVPFGSTIRQGFVSRICSPRAFGCRTSQCISS